MALEQGLFSPVTSHGPRCVRLRRAAVIPAVWAHTWAAVDERKMQVCFLFVSNQLQLRSR